MQNTTFKLLMYFLLAYLSFINMCFRYEQPLIVASISSTLQNSSVSVGPTSIDISPSISMMPAEISSVPVSIASKTSQSSKGLVFLLL